MDMERLRSVGVPFVDANRVPVGIKDHRHAADWRWERLHSELNFLRTKMRDRCVEVFNFKRGAAAVRTWFPAWCGADRQRIRSEFVFDPFPIRRIGDGRWLESEHAFIESACPRHVRDRVTAESKFNDFDHSQETSFTIFWAASAMESPLVIVRPLCASVALPAFTLLPSKRTTSGNFKPVSRTAATMPFAMTLQSMIPPKMLTRMPFTFTSLRMILNAAVTCSLLAPPPT